MTEIRADYLTRFKPAGREPLADAPISVVLPKDLDAYVRGLRDRSEWLRDAVAQKRARELRAGVYSQCQSP